VIKPYNSISNNNKTYESGDLYSEFIKAKMSTDTIDSKLHSKKNSKTRIKSPPSKFRADQSNDYTS
jgi:hypothetical protein